ncbi:MAG TPA: 2-oxo-4-hydroxy-4-carboxy-5-ureidoimidazoline decarboxylase [Candidatus Dormibacteraeota bacterium]|nr:2-oxo-4-hydroxy-4-carboxy-5-ureidoimidazoline decarboxylase [Candidatus Dormibacteraeota bacterium]
MDRFNALPAGEAEEQLHMAFASRAWAVQVAAGRPYRNVDELMRAADAAWSDLTPGEWREAMAAHPRIGERGGDAPRASANEQRRAMEASRETLTALAAENLQYEKRFGHVFLIFASGRTGDEILAELRRRMNNDPATEFAEARVELRRIAQMRLEKLATS